MFDQTIRICSYASSEVAQSKNERFSTNLK
jgi:hypothetical protein